MAKPLTYTSYVPSAGSMQRDLLVGGARSGQVDEVAVLVDEQVEVGRVVDRIEREPRGACVPAGDVTW